MSISNSQGEPTTSFQDTGDGHVTHEQLGVLDYSHRTENLQITLNGDHTANVHVSGHPEKIFPEITTVHTGSGNDTITGDHACNVLKGGSGNDKLWGRNGTDTLVAGLGYNFVDGGGGDDTISYEDHQSSVHVDLSHESHTILGRGVLVFFSGGMNFLSNVENVTGGSAGDVLTGNDKNNILSGLDGADVLSGKGGEDTLDGGNGDDILKGGEGKDILIGGDGRDVADYSDRKQAIVLHLRENEKVGNFVGGLPEDTLIGIEDIVGGLGDDVLIGDGQDSHLSGGPGNDVLAGDHGNDTLVGGEGKDILAGGQGNDTADYSEREKPIVVTLEENENVHESFGKGIYVAGLLEDSLASIENVIGGLHDDQLTGNYQANILSGGPGNDKLRGAGGDDILRDGIGGNLIDGGPGIDTVDYSDQVDPVRASLEPPLDTMAGPQVIVFLRHGVDSLVNIENITGGQGNDWLKGDKASNTLLGGDGTDVLAGNGGNDILKGQGGNDALVGKVGSMDHLDGGDGHDTVTYSGETLGIHVSLDGRNESPVLVNGALEDKLKDIENVIGGDGDDHIIGDAADNTLMGRGGKDTLTGGDGKDVFSYSVTDEAQGDIITDFEVGRDILDFSAIDGLQFSTMGPQPNSLWTREDQGALRLLGDGDGDTSTLEINISLTGVESLPEESLLL